MKTFLRTGVLLALPLLIGACADELPEPIRRERTEVRFMADWSDLASDIPVPEAWRLRIGNDSYPVEGNTTGITLLSASDYTAVAYTEAEGISVSGTNAVLTARSGAAATVGHLSAAVVDLTGLQGKRSLDMPLRMQQRTFGLNFVLNFGKRNITAATGTLSNVASCVDLRTGKFLSAGEIAMDFSIPDAGERSLTASVRIFGVMPESSQVLSLELSTPDGPVVVESDLTEALAGLASRDDNTALTLGADLDAEDLFGSVSDWTVVEGGPIVPEKKNQQ